MMRETRVLEPFLRVLDGGQEPSDHQRQFLHLPLPTFRDFTNIRSIVIKHFSRTDGKQMKQIEIQQKIKSCHQKMGELDKWKEHYLDELEFIPSDGDEV